MRRPRPAAALRVAGGACRGDLAGARRYAWYGLAVAAATQVACLATLPWLGAVLDLLPYEPGVRDAMGDYLAVRLLSGGAAIGIEALANAYGGQGRTRPGMVANLAAMTLNVALNWVLIFGHLGALLLFPVFVVVAMRIHAIGPDLDLRQRQPAAGDWRPGGARRPAAERRVSQVTT